VRKEALPTSCAANKKIISILHLEDIATDSALCLLELKRSRFDASIDVVQTVEEFSAYLSSKQYDIVLADYQLPGWNGMHAFEIFRTLGYKAPFILVTGAIGEEKVAECLKKGVTDFVFKHHLARLPLVVERALADQQLRDQHEKSAAALRESEQRFRTLAESVASGILIYQGVDCRYANRKAEEITGYRREQLALMSSWEIIHPDSRDRLIEECLARVQSDQPTRRFELKILTKAGAARWVDMTLGRIEISGEPAGLFTLNDITERKIAEEEILSVAGNDPLTGLANGRYLVDSFNAEARRYARTERTFSLLVFDLDGLKQINDKYGHLIGSRALCRVANVLRSQCRNIDIMARPGGDEFTVILPETTMGGAETFAKRICQRLSEDHQHPPLAVSFGAAVYPGSGTFEDLFAAADNALYAMKIQSPHGQILKYPAYVDSQQA
jgi:diguanylate cyclase (GGDEF)-like protein/PAS domain S-box-containing protein